MSYQYETPSTVSDPLSLLRSAGISGTGELTYTTNAPHTECSIGAIILGGKPEPGTAFTKHPADVGAIYDLEANELHVVANTRSSRGVSIGLPGHRQLFEFDERVDSIGLGIVNGIVGLSFISRRRLVRPRNKLSTEALIGAADGLKLRVCSKLIKRLVEVPGV